MDFTPPKMTFLAISKPNPFRPDTKMSELAMRRIASWPKTYNWREYNDSSMSPVPVEAPPLEIEAIPDELLELVVVEDTVELVPLLLLLALFVCCFAVLESTSGEFACFFSVLHEEEFLWSPLFTTLLSLSTADDVLMPPLLPLSPVDETIEPAAFSQLNETSEQDEDTNDKLSVCVSLALAVVVSTTTSVPSPSALPQTLLLLLRGLLEVGEELDASFRFLAAGCSRVEEEAACSTTWGLEDICCYQNKLHHTIMNLSSSLPHETGANKSH